MPDWSTQGGPGAGQEPGNGLRVLAYILIGLAIGVVLIKLGLAG